MDNDETNKSRVWCGWFYVPKEKKGQKIKC